MEEYPAPQPEPVAPQVDTMAMFEEEYAPVTPDPLSFMATEISTGSQPGAHDISATSIDIAEPIAQQFDTQQVDAQSWNAAPVQQVPMHGSFDMPSVGDAFSVPAIPAAYTPPVTAIPTPKETSKLREWEQQHEADLDIKTKQEVEQKQEMRQKASADLQRWYEDKQQLLAKRKATHRSDEMVLLAQRDAANQCSANPWERVASLIDQSTVKPDANSEEATNVAKRADVSRMKQILIQLKSNPLPPVASNAVPVA
eukprot:GEMP01035339.1.p1 GENE.GEMP01035339.1~~GEMP01035339.1.p1  ORF type:complete len:255 (+),score=65.48 GEMP01035339.1:140-904(+)